MIQTNGFRKRLDGKVAIITGGIHMIDGGFIAA
jgi:hypothetical protein